jgi:hypothetical protein
MMQLNAALAASANGSALAAPPPTPQPATIVISLIGVPPEDLRALAPGGAGRARREHRRLLTFHPNISFRGPQALWVRAS